MAALNLDEEGSLSKTAKKKRKLDYLSHNFEDHYHLTNVCLGSGSFSTVDECLRKSDGQPCAAKCIDKNLAIFSRQKVLKEIETYYLCRGHPSIIQLLEYFEDSRHFRLVFEKLEGGPLLNLIHSRSSFSEWEASRIIKDLASALSFLHDRGIAHRDVKPDNVLCVNMNEPSPVKLCDFDLCSRESTALKTPKLQTPVGSLEYMAPEVLDTFFTMNHDLDDDDLTYDKKCDIWSLGVLLYYLLSGYPPFIGNCGRDCGWDRNEACERCQENLSNSIRMGHASFTGSQWNLISPDAKSLVENLLEKDSKNRLDARQVLHHPWIRDVIVGSNLITPGRLKRQTSICIQELSNFVESTMSLNRAMSFPEHQTRLKMLHSKSVDRDQVLAQGLRKGPHKVQFRKLKNHSHTVDLESSTFSSIDELQ